MGRIIDSIFVNVCALSEVFKWLVGFAWYGSVKFTSWYAQAFFVIGIQFCGYLLLSASSLFSS
jgi:uncharacterized protein (DUF486 family)